MGKYTYVVTGSLMLTTEWSDWSNCNYYWIGYKVFMSVRRAVIKGCLKNCLILQRP